jgi:hypothetical protein
LAPGEIGRKNLRHRGDGHDRHVEPIKRLPPLLTKHAENERAYGGSEQGGTGEHRGIQAADMGDAERGQHQRQHHPDRGEVIPVGEHAHPRGEDGPPVKRLEWLIVERRESCLRHDGSFDGRRF